MFGRMGTTFPSGPLGPSNDLNQRPRAVDPLNYLTELARLLARQAAREHCGRLPCTGLTTPTNHPFDQNNKE